LSKRAIAALVAVLALAGCGSAASHGGSVGAPGSAASHGGSVGAPATSCKVTGGDGTWNAVVKIDNNTGSPVGTDLQILVLDSDGQPVSGLFAVDAPLGGTGGSLTMAQPVDSDGSLMTTVRPGQSVATSTAFRIDGPASAGSNFTCQVQG
jgi:hypothetical protein